MKKRIFVMVNMLIVFGFIGILAVLAQAPDTTAPVISGVGATSITQTAVSIGWTTNEPADGQVEYGTSTTYGLSGIFSTATTTAHQISLSALTASTTYHYLVKSKDVVGNLATSTDFSFTTAIPAPPATTTASVVVKVKVEPKTLNAKSKGKWIEAEVAFPKGYDARQIDIASIKLNGTLAPATAKVKKAKWYEVFGSNKTQKVEMKFSREAVTNLLLADIISTATSTATSTTPRFSYVTREVKISGNVGTSAFGGATTIRILIDNVTMTSKVKVRKEEERRREDEHRKEEDLRREDENRREHSFQNATSTNTIATTTNNGINPFLRKDIKKEDKKEEKSGKNENNEKKGRNGRDD